MIYLLVNYRIVQPTLYFTLIFFTFTSGVVTYVSPAYGGSTSDRQIIERSELLKDGKFESGDSIMADRGIMVSFSNRHICCNSRSSCGTQFLLFLPRSLTSEPSLQGDTSEP